MERERELERERERERERAGGIKSRVSSSASEVASRVEIHFREG